jgi:hypothetical protein
MNVRQRVARVAGLVAATGAAGLAGAAPAAAGPVVGGVTIDCAGDAVVGRVGLGHAERGVARVTLLGRNADGRFAPLARTAVRTAPGVREISYSFALGRHRAQYRVRAVVDGSSRVSQVVHDRTCQPPAQVPEAGSAVAIPLAMGAAGGAAWYVRRRRGAAGG